MDTPARLRLPTTTAGCVALVGLMLVLAPYALVLAPFVALAELGRLIERRAKKPLHK